jgi:hypothetical protein
MEKLINLLIHDEPLIKKEAIWAVCNSTAGATPEQFGMLVKGGILKAMVFVLNFTDPNILTVALEGIENILKCGQKNFVNVSFYL